jgi:alpha-beta hydrolase superfamily lysophospholipase
MMYSRKSVIRLLLLVFVVLNAVSFFHAYRFTHFAEPGAAKTRNAGELSWAGRCSALVFGVGNPRPENTRQPQQSFETLYIAGRQRLEGWLIRTPDSRGTVAVFHGFSGSKSGLLDKAAVFVDLGYSVLLVDFAGSGGSEGDETTIGYREADDVKASYDFLRSQGETNIVLFGTSMGAAAVLRAAAVYGIEPQAAILECPFGSMYATTCARFREMGVPCFPMAALLVFWGGVQHGFWAFGHNPVRYARSADFPLLLLYGAKDNKVSSVETRSIYAALPGPKTLRVYAEAGHENYLKRYRHEWQRDVAAFLEMHAARRY